MLWAWTSIIPEQICKSILLISARGMDGTIEQLLQCTTGRYSIAINPWEWLSPTSSTLTMWGCWNEERIYPRRKAVSCFPYLLIIRDVRPSTQQSLLCEHPSLCALFPFLPVQVTRGFIVGDIACLCIGNNQADVFECPPALRTIQRLLQGR